MKQLRIRDPWADLAGGSDQHLVTELLSRVQVLENKLRELEDSMKEVIEDKEPVAV